MANTSSKQGIYTSMAQLVKLPDIISLGGLVFAVFSIYLSLNQQFVIAAICIFVAMLMDFLDGKVSRKMKRQGSFGKEVDNLCDVVLYLLAVVLFTYSAGLNSLAALFVYIVFISAGVLRLARFGIHGIVSGHYEGLPVTNAVIIPVLYFILLRFSVDLVFLLAYYMLSAALMVSSLKIKKI